MSAQKIVTIVGATGAQGKGVVAAFINDPAYRVRAVTRNTTSASAQALSAQGAELVQADVDDVSSLERAFAGSHIIFGLTNFFEPFISLQSPEKAQAIEIQHGINLARAAASTLSTLEHYIWSTLPDAATLTGGKYQVPHFDGKVKVDTYIREKLPQLNAKTTYLWVTWYHSNYIWPIFTPYHIPTAEKYVQFASFKPDTPLTTIGDVSVNLALFVRAIIAQPEKTYGQVVVASVDTYTADEMLQRWAAAKGLKAQFVQVSGKAFRELWPLWGEEMGVMMEFWDEAREDSWSASGSGGRKVLYKEDLAVEGLQSVDEAFKEFELPELKY
ncbi:hypothetical protein B0H63DRAFT_464254 [Podospora didyma]|uniref:NmrA-like domain-containing protein n=1 Tax=Podospora didyma TaxID=330526 RepID=A0AAE0NY41_9PEZI|nr:hypothetical protein B0H63DRAFT_464254 [Podospora didyma]